MLEVIFLCWLFLLLFSAFITVIVVGAYTFIEVSRKKARETGWDTK